MADSDNRSSSPVDGNTVAESSKAAAVRPPMRSSSSSNMNGPLYMQKFGSKNVVLVRRLKQKEVSFSKQFTRWFIENQIGLSFNLLALLFLAHFFIPRARVHTRKFFTLSYHNSRSGEYATGADDAYLITFFIVLFTGLRACTMDYILAPFAKRQGVKTRKDLTRFTEQAWLLVYYSVFWTMGVYLWSISPYFFVNLKELWTAWPHREITGLMKFYTLAQLSFWLQQIIVINIEERRKDHWQMLSHHIITSILISSCYSYHHTRVGNFILVIMDVVDIFFPVAKCLKYTGHNLLCDIAFGFFMVSWFVARHVAYIMVCWSIYAETPHIMPTGCFKGDNDNLVGPFDPPEGISYLFEPFYKATGLVCYNESVKWGFLTPLLLLQGITVFWFIMILRVAAKVISGNGAEDSRSDDEGVEDEEEDEYVYEEAEAVQEEVGVEALDLKSWERRHGVKIQAGSSGVSLPGHSDRKELLGRIGCEKQVD